MGSMYYYYNQIKTCLSLFFLLFSLSVQNILYCTESENSKKNRETTVLIDNKNSKILIIKIIQHRSHAPCPSSEFVLQFFTLLYRVIPHCKWRLTGGIFLIGIFYNTYNYDNLPFLIRIKSVCICSLTW